GGKTAPLRSRLYIPRAPCAARKRLQLHVPQLFRFARFQDQLGEDKSRPFDLLDAGRALRIHQRQVIFQSRYEMIDAEAALLIRVRVEAWFAGPSRDDV